MTGSARSEPRAACRNRRRTLIQPSITACAAILIAGRLAAAPGEWIKREEIPAAPGNLTLATRWQPDRGLHLRLSPPGSQAAVLLDLDHAEGRVTLLPPGSFPESVIEGSQFNLEALPVEPRDHVELLLKFRPEAWGLYIGDRPVAILPPPFLPPADLFQPVTDLPDEEHLETFFQKTADFAFEDRFLVPEDDANLLAGWEIRSGVWALHTAGDDALQRTTSAPKSRDDLKPDRSPNFYSLAARGTNAVITAGHDFYDSYTVEAAVRVAPGEMGIVFLFRDAANYHALTLRKREGGLPALISLWRVSGGTADDRKILGAIHTEIADGQWVKLKAVAYQSRVQCFLDGVQILDLPVELPGGGRFGLYATVRGEARFDDVAARSNHDLDFSEIGRLRHHTLLEEGRFFPRRRFFRIFPPRDPENSLQVAASRRPQRLVVGSAAHAGHVFAADFEPRTDEADVGLLAAYTGEDDPYYRFGCRRTEGREVFRLERVKGNAAALVEEIALTPAAGARPGTTFRLMCDASEPDAMRLYRDGELVLVHFPDSEPAGASGFCVGPGTAVRISRPVYQFKRAGLYRNRYEKNRMFVEDRFMRHWSSPEGEWIRYPDGTTWHKSDFFGRFRLRMPFVPGSEIHLGVEESATNGAVIVRAGPDHLRLTVGGADETARADSLAPGTGPDGKELPDEKWYSIETEGYWIWLASGERLLLRRRLPAPLTGSRIRIVGFSVEQLTHSRVDRFNVKDYLFTESLHEWIRSGGRWEVVNRFQCQPMWSHMNGESAEGPAGLWTKFRYGGDFCVELYAGPRHGWYDRCGDYNLTVLNRDTTPSQGYTVTCTGWDFDRSQLYTRLYRDGVKIAESDQYLVPRTREGSERRGYSPLVASGRPVHGAWYYMKLRRIGKQIEYYFDNELVFRAHDEDPISAGSLGIWTYLNSMMVARVKIAAERIEPRAFPFTPVASYRDLFPAPAPAPGPYPALLKDGQPLIAVQPANWTADDPDGLLQLSWHETPGGGPYFAVRNVPGSGSMRTSCRLPPVPYRDLAGWSFEIQRTPRAQFNFHYSIGRMEEDGTFKPSRSFFHRLSGTDFSKDARQMAGSTEVPPAAGSGTDWHAAGTWTRVRVWLPAEDFAKGAEDPALLVRVEGFGSLQPSYVHQGLFGNGPGEGYALRDFSEIRFAVPALTEPTNTPSASVSLLDPKSGSPTGADASLDEIRARLQEAEQDGLNRVTIETSVSNRVCRSRLTWIRRPAEPAVSCTWSKTRPSTIVCACDAPCPDRRFWSATLAAGGVNLPLQADGLNRRTAALPRTDRFAVAAAETVPVELTIAGGTKSFALDWKDHVLNEPPVLLAVQGVSPFFENFESREFPAALQADARRMALGRADPEQGTYLRVFNRGAGQRLRSGFRAAASAAGHPVFQFRYRASDMANVTLAPRGRTRVRISETLDNARTVRHASDLQRDGAWHTWLGILSDSWFQHRWQPDLFAFSSLDFGSLHSTDQTGQFTEWALDDLVLGPAVSAERPLTVTPHFFDHDGVARVQWAVHAGPDPYDRLDEPQRAALIWHNTENAAETTPDLSGLTDGLLHLLLRATDAQGLVSPVTDIPFLLDRRPLQVSASLEEAQEADGNGTKLRLTFATGGAPLDLAALGLRWNDTPLEPAPLGSDVQHEPENDTLILNWPYLCREHLDRAVDGQTNRLVVTGIRDGAGNGAPDLTQPMVIDFRNDRTPPTLLPATYPENILWCSAWEDPTETDVRFKGRHRDPIVLVREPGEEPYLSTESVQKKGDVYLDLAKTPWLPDAHPYLAFQIRRPAADASPDTRLDLVFGCDPKQTYTLSLTHPEDGSDRINLPEPLAWQPDTWIGLVLDIRALLAARQPDPEAIRNLKITSLHFERSNIEDKVPLHLRSLFIFSEWKPEHTVTLDAYDVSGIEGVSWECEPRAGRMGLAPGTLWGPGAKGVWVVLSVRDRAGNVSVPVRVPVGRPAPVSVSAAQPPATEAM